MLETTTPPLPNIPSLVGVVYNVAATAGQWVASLAQALLAIDHPPRPEESKSKVPGLYNRVLQLHGFLRDVSRQGSEQLVSEKVADTARTVWGALWAELGDSVPVPSASANESGAVLLYWDRSRHHLEVEVMPDATCSWFYGDRELAQAWEETSKPARPPARALAILREAAWGPEQRRPTSVTTLPELPGTHRR